VTDNSILYTIFLIFTGAAVLATVALFARQSLLIAYIAIGLIAGPHVTGLVADPALVADIANVGIIFLLFLLGLNLEPDDLLSLLREATVVTVLSSFTFALTGFVIARVFGFNTIDSIVIGTAKITPDQRFTSSAHGRNYCQYSALTRHYGCGRVTAAGRTRSSGLGNA